MVDAGGMVIWLGSAREDLVRGTVLPTIASRKESRDRSPIELLVP